MKVPVFKELSCIEFQDRPVPEPGPGEVLVKVEYCGICGSDVHGFLNGILIPPGTVMGHESTGVVARIGAGVEDWHPGDRVAIKPIPECGECFACRAGRYSLCTKAFERGIGVTPANDGAFAEYVLIRHPREMLFKLPDSVTFQDAALVEPLATGLHAVRMSRVRPGDRVVVMGAGMIGLAVLQFLKMAGAGRIIVLEVSAAKARIAADMGASVVLNPAELGDGLRQKVFELTDGIGADVVFECAGVPATFQACPTLCKSGGQIMLVGINDKEVAINPFFLILWEVEMKAVLAYYDEFRQVIEFLAQKRIDTAPFISGIIPLEDLIEKGFNRLLTSKDLVKILVKP